MKKLLLTIMFIFACGGSGDSSAQNISATYARIVLIKCADGVKCISQDDALMAFEKAQYFFKTQLGRELYLSGVDVIADPEPNKFMTTSEFWINDYRFRLLGQLVGKVKINARKPEFFLVYDKYLTGNGLRYNAGRSHLCGIYNPDNYSVIYATDVFAERLKTRFASVTAHELGHWHGASHNDFESLNFMSADIKDVDVLNIPPTLRTLAEINQCMSRRAYVQNKQCNKSRRPKLCKQKFGLRSQDKTIGEVFGVSE
jgi:predicted Zn-dependent protease